MDAPDAKKDLPARIANIKRYNDHFEQHMPSHVVCREAVEDYLKDWGCTLAESTAMMELFDK